MNKAKTSRRYSLSHVKVKRKWLARKARLRIQDQSAISQYTVRSRPHHAGAASTPFIPFVSLSLQSHVELTLFVSCQVISRDLHFKASE
jgi:hypothetical protein